MLSNAKFPRVRSVRFRDVPSFGQSGSTFGGVRKKHATCAACYPQTRTDHRRNDISITNNDYYTACNEFFHSLVLEVGRNLRVKHQHKGGSDGTESIGTSTLEEGSSTFISDDLGEAVSSALVNPLFLGLFGLHLQTTTDGIKGVRSVTGRDGRGLGAGELGEGTDDTILVRLVRVVSREGVKETKVDTTVGDDTNNGDSHTIVETSDTTGLDSLLQAIQETVELLLSTSDIGSKTGTGVIQGVDDHEGSGTSKTSRGHVDEEKLSKLGILVSLGEHGLNTILEGKVKSLGGEVTDDVSQVSTPEGSDTLFTGHTGEAVDDTGVTGHLTTDNLGVGILGLDQELDSLNGSGGCLGNSTRKSTSEEINEEIVRHLQKG